MLSPGAELVSVGTSLRYDLPEQRSPSRVRITGCWGGVEAGGGEVQSLQERVWVQVVSEPVGTDRASALAHVRLCTVQCGGAQAGPLGQVGGRFQSAWNLQVEEEEEDDDDDDTRGEEFNQRSEEVRPTRFRQSLASEGRRGSCYRFFTKTSARGCEGWGGRREGVSTRKRERATFSK